MTLTVSVDEAHALEVLDLLCRGRPIRITPERPIEEPRVELVDLAARRIAAVCLRVLAESGRREQVVLRGGRRVRGRIWDRGLADGFRLRFTEATYEMWIQMTGRLAEVARSSEVVDGRGSTRRARRQIRRIIKVAETDTGDWLLYGLAVRHLARAEIPPEIREDFERRLCLGSPLAALFALSDRAGEGGPGMAQHLDLLLEGPAVRLLECCEDLLVSQWIFEIGAALRRPGAAARLERLQAIARSLHAFVDVLDARRRLDLCRALARALAELAAGPWAEAPDAFAQRVSSDAGVVLVSQRDALRRAAARIVGLGERLMAFREALVGEAFGDPRYEEGQLFLQVVDDHLAPHARHLGAIYGALTGRIG